MNLVSQIKRDGAGNTEAPEKGSLPVSVFVITFNEEDNIGRCLASAAWAKEIVVVDAFSSDRTCEIARGFTDKVFSHAYEGMVQQKGYALSRATQPWAMLLDADEAVSPELRASIQRAVLRDDPAVDGYVTPRRTSYAGGWIRHGGWYPDYKLRLFRRERGKIVGKNPHDYVAVPGRTERLEGDLLHYSYPTVASQVETINRFSTMSLREVKTPWRSLCLVPMLVKPIAKFATCYIVKRGWMDGMRGLIIALASSFYVFLKYAKLWERDRALRDG